MPWTVRRGTCSQTERSDQVELRIASSDCDGFCLLGKTLVAYLEIGDRGDGKVLSLK
jgi:hypothetical protein